MHFIRTNPYNKWIFYLLMQALVFASISLYLFLVVIDLRQLQVVVGLLLLCLALSFVLLTVQGENRP